MNRKELTESVASKFEIRPGKARKIVDHVLSQLLEAGLSGEGFSSPILRISSKDVPEKAIEVPDGEPKTIPARRVMRLLKSKAYVVPVQSEELMTEEAPNLHV